MDINSFAHCLKELISQNEKVAVPRLGLFFAAMNPANFSDNHTVIHPPFWQVRFSKTEVSPEEGRLFLSQIEKYMNCSSEQAQTELEWCISRLKTELEQAKTCIIPGLGVMKADSQNEYYFIHGDSEFNYYEGLGLEPVYVRQAKYNNLKKKKNRSKHSVFGAIASVIVIILILSIGIVVASYLFKEDYPLADQIWGWCDNALNHLLYSKEELELLGL